MLTFLLIGHSLAMQLSVSVLGTHALHSAPLEPHSLALISTLQLHVRIRAAAERACASHRWWDHKTLIKIQSNSFVIAANTPTESTRTPKLAQ